ncbi:MAG: aminotransferase class V-fold PLP-dependent enzyme [Ruminiclostridium sp.]|nr:aminotransferase class V-fold PLP-dependent enzyme [Ruminiclostridium sp.]
MFFKKAIYLDNTATTRTRKEVASVINRYFSGIYGNPSSAHGSGLIARGSVEMARERIAKVLNCSSNELIFTGSGSEGNNTAIKGVLKAAGKYRHIITSRIEHSSILNTCKSLENEGVNVTYIGVDGQGRYDLNQLQHEIREDTALVSLSYVNNEIGTVQDMDRTCLIVKSKGVILHIDAVQALPYFDIDMTRLKADLVTFSGHKLYAPKGIGILYIREGTPIEAIISGGEQEFGLRSGTENVAYIVGLSKAIALNQIEKRKYVSSLVSRRDKLIEGVLNKVNGSILTGDPSNRAPNNASFCFKGLSGKMLVRQLSWYGIEVSSGSACSSPKNEPSHVLSACKISDDYINGSLRVTLGRYNTQKDINKFLKVLPELVCRMREQELSYNNNPVFISQEELKRKLNSGEAVQVLDVRPFNYPKFRIPGSICMPIWKLKSNLNRLNPKIETIVVCHQGDVVAPEAHQILSKKGFSNVKVLKGGLAGYIELDRVPYLIKRFG